MPPCHLCLTVIEGGQTIHISTLLLLKVTGISGIIIIPLSIDFALGRDKMVYFLVSSAVGDYYAASCATFSVWTLLFTVIT